LKVTEDERSVRTTVAVPKVFVPEPALGVDPEFDLEAAPPRHEGRRLVPEHVIKRGMPHPP